MSEVYVPETSEQLLRLAQGYITPDAIEPALKPMPQEMQDFLAAIVDLEPQSHVRHSILNQEEAILPGVWQTEAYARKQLTRLPKDVMRGELELNRQIGVRLGYGRQILKSAARVEYLVADTAIRCSPYVGSTILKETLGAILSTLDSRPHQTTLQIYPSERVTLGTGGLTLIYPKGAGSAPELTRGFVHKNAPPQRLTGPEVIRLEE